MTRQNGRRVAATLLSTLALTASSLAFLSSPAQAAPPPNDNFASAQVVGPALPVSVTGTNVDATVEAAEPQHWGRPPRSTVWYRWTAPATQAVEINLAGSSFDTILAVYTGSNLAGLTEVASDDDTYHDDGAVRISAVSGTTYQIAVGGYGDTAKGTIQLAIGRLGTVTGTVTGPTGAALADACVRAWPVATGGYTEYAETAADGSYDLLLGPGDYHVRFEGCGQNVTPEWYDNSVSFAGADPVTVVGGATVANINAQLAVGGSISGTVSGPAGPLANACVDVWTDDGEQYYEASDGTDGAGAYTVDGLPPGAYTVYFYGCGHNVIGEYYDNATSSSAALDVVVGLGQQVTGINAQLAAAGAISGTITVPAGVDLYAICVEATNTATGDERYGYPSTSTGQYTVTQLVAGSYRLRFYDCENETDTVAQEYYNDVADPAAATLVAVTAGTTTPNINAALGAPGTQPGGGGGGGVVVHPPPPATGPNSPACAGARTAAAGTAAALLSAESTVKKAKKKVKKLKPVGGKRLVKAKAALKKAKKAASTAAATNSTAQAQAASACA